MLPAILKQSKFGKIGALVLLLVVGGVLFFGLARMNAPKKSDGEAAKYDVGTTPTGQMKGFVDHYGNVVDRQAKDISTQGTQLDRLTQENDEFRKGAEDLRTELAQLKAALRAREENGDPMKRALVELKRQLFPDGPPTSGETSPARIRKLTIATAKQESDRRRAQRQVRVPAGSFAEGTLLTGVYAPTEGQPMPVKIRLDRAFVGPNRTRIPFQEAFLIGKAVGDPNSERVVVQLDRLSYVKQNGETIEVAINGYVVDEDGVQGVAGQYVWRAFDVASLGVLSGALSAGTDAAAARETLSKVNPLGGASQVVTGDPLRFATFRGLSKAGEGIDKIVVKRLDEIVPAVYVPNGRHVTVCLIDGVTLENVFVDEMKHETARNAFAGLDLDR
ncbi:MAG: TraB/VirB10 family protein [Planctomycetes bacterium]|nr:TraB/VirB10 family protein [Planctomycetota bacterium]